LVHPGHGCRDMAMVGLPGCASSLVACFRCGVKDRLVRLLN
jgi:hypothetical protein